jgi:hypothetical protein
LGLLLPAQVELRPHCPSRLWPKGHEDPKKEVLRAVREFGGEQMSADDKRQFNRGTSEALRAARNAWNGGTFIAHIFPKADETQIFFSVKTPSGARYTLCKPGIADGAYGDLTDDVRRPHGNLFGGQR